MPRLNAREIRRLAWDDLAAKQYWLFVAGRVVQAMIVATVCIVGLLAALLPVLVAVVSASSDGACRTGADVWAALDPVTIVASFVGACVACGPFLYAIGFGRWGETRMALAAVGRTLRFEDCLSGWGHGWKMCWTVLVQWTYIQLWALLFVIPGIVKAFAYAMTPYVRVEHPDWTPTQCITESRRLMDGNKLRLFGLGFSFIGWYLLLIVAVCVPVAGSFAAYFLNPYVYTAFARFYDTVKREKGEPLPS